MSCMLLRSTEALSSALCWFVQKKTTLLDWKSCVSDQNLKIRVFDWTFNDSSRMIGHHIDVMYARKATALD